MMDIRFLSTFLEVAKNRHFGKAADNLFLTQSAVSARIKILEEYFDTDLFIRNRNSIQLTSSGEILVPFAEQISQSLQQAKNAVSNEATKIVNCACTHNAYFVNINGALANISEGVKDIAVRSDLANIELISRQLHDRSIDIAFTTEPLKLDNVESMSLLAIPLALFSNRQGREPFQYIHIEWQQKISDAFFKGHSEFTHSRLKTSSANIGLAQLLNTPNGCALLPVNINSSQQISEDRRLVKLNNELDISLTLNVYMSVVQGNVSPEVKTLKEYFVKQLRR